jgi:AraC-like DNA-binding protein
MINIMKYTKYDNQTISQIEYFDFLINNISPENLIHGHCKLSSDWNHKDICSPFHRIYFVLDGEGLLSRYDEKIPLVPGKIYLIPANTTWSYSCAESMEQFFIHLKILLMKGVDVFDSCNECMIINYALNDIAEIIRTVETGTLDAIIYFKSFLFKIIAEIILKYKINVRAQIERVGKYESLLSYICDNCSAELQVSDVVSFMNSSQSTIYRNLKEDTGHSIKSYIDKTLLSESQEYLLLSNNSIKEIASLLKFKDQYYFSKFFKKHTGMPPSKYREFNKFEH